MGVLTTRDLLFGVYGRAPDFAKVPYLQRLRHISAALLIHDRLLAT